MAAVQCPSGGVGTQKGDQEDTIGWMPLDRPDKLPRRTTLR
jgi:hypothetical protein